jgi:CubicO group peptidase (beta-lactamase class C family)
MDGDTVGPSPPAQTIGSIDAESIERDIRHLAPENVTPGVSISLGWGDQIVDVAVGMRCTTPSKPMSTETRFPSACVVKALIALVACELHARGELDVDQPVAKYLPELADDRSSEPITLAHLMSHTGGYVEPQTDDVRWRMDFDGFAAAFRSADRVFKPGTVWGYSQTGSAIVGQVIHKITGDDPLEIIRRELLAPLDIDLRPDFQNSSADVAASHISTRLGFRPIKLPDESPLLRHSISARTVRASDLLTIGRMIAGSLRPAFVSNEAYRLFSTPVIDVPTTSGGGRKEATPTRYGLGRALYGDLVGQTGSYAGATNSVRVDPVTGASAALCMTSWTPGLRDHLLAHILRRMTGNEAIVPPTRCRIDRPIEQWAGHYTSLMLGGGKGRMEMQSDGKLHCAMEWGNGEKFEATLSADDDGYIRGKVSQPHVAVGLNYSEANGEPYLMMGTIAYKRSPE